MSSDKPVWMQDFYPLRTKKELEGKELIAINDPPTPTNRYGQFEMLVRDLSQESMPIVRVVMTTRDITDVIDQYPSNFTFVPTPDGKWSNVAKYTK